MRPFFIQLNTFQTPFMPLEEGVYSIFPLLRKIFAFLRTTLLR